MTIENPRWLWVELPCRWVRVIARLTHSAERSPLDEVLIRLVSFKACTAEELSLKLGGVPSDVIGSALASLAAEGRIHEESGPVTRWLSAPGAEERSVERETGWLGVAPHDDFVLPDFVQGEAARIPPRSDESGGHQCVSLIGSAPPGLPRGLDEKVRDAIRRGIRTVKADDSGLELASAVLDLEGSRGGQPIAAVRSCWALVELVPSPTGSVAPIFHEPALTRRLSSLQPVSRRLEPWLKEHLPETWEQIERHRKDLQQAGSVVLQLAGIQSMEALDAFVEEHRRRWATRLESPGLFETSDERLRAAMRDAHRWVHIARQQPQFVRQAHDSLGHAFERMAQVLADRSRPALRQWKRERDRANRDEHQKEKSRWKQPAEVIKELAALPSGALGPSEKHLTAAVLDLGHIAAKIDVDLGAGASLTQFLLPLLLGAPEERNALKGQLASALRREPQLFSFLDELLALRDAAAHARLAPVHLERADELMARSFAAMKVAFRADSHAE